MYPTIITSTDGAWLVCNESVVAGMHLIEEDDDLALEDDKLIGSVHIGNIYRTADGSKGRASELLRAITKWADSHGYTLTLYPCASGDLSQQNLIAWYERNGFHTTFGGLMIRRPTWK